MKRLLALLLLSLSLAGCAAKSPVTAPVPGSINSFDALSYRTLMDAQAAIQSVKGSALATQQKAVVNQAIQDYNVAEAAWQAYHAGATSNPAALTAAINALVADVAAITTQLQGGK